MSNLTNEPDTNWGHVGLLTALVLVFGGLFGFAAFDSDAALILFWSGLGLGLLVVVFTTDWHQEFKEIRRWLPWIGLTIAFSWGVNELGFANTAVAAIILVNVWLFLWWLTTVSSSSSRPSDTYSDSTKRSGPFRDSGADNPLDDLDGDG